MKDSIIFRKEQFYFRKIIEEDLEPLRIMHNDSSTIRMLTDTTQVSVAMQKKWFMSLDDSSKSRRYSICMYEDGKEILLGMMRLDQIDKLNKNMLVGLDIMPKFRGKGYGKASFRLMLDYCFSELDMHKVTLYTAVYNKVAIGLYTSLGFKEEGVLKEHLLREDGYHDLLVMSLFRDAYLC
ncbi:MAG: GNAT family N-acetyltransferase [Candidatus Woesearchaeota archaeon]|nr:GNAT family N-acetyltransferase [Candidatus Woesearchaeota archaeon]